jgi:hypothetical protein
LQKDHRRLYRLLESPTSGPPKRLSGHSRLILITIAGVLAATLVSACGDSQGKTPGTTTPTEAVSPTPADMSVPGASPTAPPEQELLEQMVLQTEDLPAGLSQVSAVASPNEDAAQAAANPEKELARLESWGRLFGYDVVFLPGPDSSPDLTVMGVNSTASIYVTPEGASASFADDVQAARSQDWTASYPDLINLNVQEIKRPQLADEVFWIRITGHQKKAKGPLSIEDFVALRRSRVRGFLRVTSLLPASAKPDASLKRTADLAARQVERINMGLVES